MTFKFVLSKLPLCLPLPVSLTRCWRPAVKLNATVRASPHCYRAEELWAAWLCASWPSFLWACCSSWPLHSHRWSGQFLLIIVQLFHEVEIWCNIWLPFTHQVKCIIEWQWQLVHQVCNCDCDRTWYSSDTVYKYTFAITTCFIWNDTKQRLHFKKFL